MHSNKFNFVPGNTEWPEHYVHGGFHPLRIGDTVAGRYIVERKLGSGRSSTVWLARHLGSGSFAALKIGQALGDTGNEESRILRSLSEAKDVGVPFVQHLIESFDIDGPNGTHHVLALDPLGQTLQDFLWTLQYRLDAGKWTYDCGLMRALSAQMSRALRFIHSRGIVHRDIQLGNFMFALSKPVEGIIAGERDTNLPTTYPLTTVDGSALTAGQPPYLVEPRPLQDHAASYTIAEAARLRLTDFGSAVTVERASDGQQTYPLALRAPEIVMGGMMDEKADVWALGCSIYRLVTFRDLFYVDDRAESKLRDKEHVQSMVEALGPPEALGQVAMCKQLEIIDDQGKLTHACAEDSLSDPLDVQLQSFASYVRPGSSTTIKQFEEFMRYVLRWDAASRPSAEEVLEHPWIVDHGQGQRQAGL
ncbi:hypothetical protein KVT40_000524 [Elsinoe batatas]|uniref:Protein kinase domain-containing protein n=1 Tax=Elsinoe batatas TaxID=2601811 RepID=A0A8K0L7X1_9PEZI|nr:hypothetical protein KVT40_000524 [Elsinoe batatas]